MRLTSDAIVDGRIHRAYGKYGHQFIKSMPVYSLPLRIEEAPLGTVSFAVILIDPDSVPVSGFVWIHWLAANLTRPFLKAGESMHATDFIQGVNSWASPLLTAPLTRAEAARYGGMAPHDKSHVYVLKAYALDAKLNLCPGFYLNELLYALKGHVLARAVLTGVYEP